MAELVDESYRKAGSVKSVKMLDDLKNLGYQYATKAGFSISMDDMVIPKEKTAQLKKAQVDVNKINMQHLVDLRIWDQVVEGRAALEVLKTIDHAKTAIVTDDYNQFMSG